MYSWLLHLDAAAATAEAAQALSLAVHIVFEATPLAAAVAAVSTLHYAAEVFLLLPFYISGARCTRRM